MKKFFILLSSVLGVISIIIFYRLYFFKIEESQKTVSFNQWYSPPIRNTSGKFTQLQRKVESPLFRIDGIYRSMQGPFASQEFFLPENAFSVAYAAINPELLWVTGYKVELFDSLGNPVSSEFMCHNNINLGHNNVLPWYNNTLGTDKRIFTLTEGQTELHFPKGFGIPILSNQKLRVDFQVLNHNQKNILLHVKQVVTVFYLEDDECNTNMRALRQQAVFVTKQISGPAGLFNDPVYEVDSICKKVSDDSIKFCCNKSLYDSSVFNPFKDSYGREYTGHWDIPDSVEILRTNVTQMLNLKSNCKAFFFSAHVHPFCEEISLIDESSQKQICKARIKNFESKIGIETIPCFSVPSGVELHQDHKYILQCRYNKKDPDAQNRHTAMATAFVYFEEQ